MTEEKLSTSQENKIEIVKLQGEVNLIHHKIDTIKDNHLHHIDEKVNLIYKVVWVIFGISLTGVANLVVTLLTK
jgi:hypothetical protein